MTQRQFTTALAAAMLALVPSCGHLPPCPAAGGPQWTELESAHFRLRTDESADEGRAKLTDLEQLRAALLTVVGGAPDLDIGRLTVIVVADGWTDFAARNVHGYFTHVLFQPLIVLAAASRAFLVDVVKHELVHYLSFKIIPKQPPWFAEGIATYYQTIEYDADAGRITVGRPAPDLLRAAQQIGVSTIANVFTAKTIAPDDTGRFYAGAWISVHYLMNHRAIALQEYERALRDDASPEAAFTAAFGAQTPAQLALEIRQYLDGGRYEMLTYRLDKPAVSPAAERRLSDADAHATRAMLYLTGSSTRRVAAGESDAKAATRHELDEALRAEPDHVVAGALDHFVFKAPVNVARAIHATEANPDDWLAWLLVAEGLRARGDRASGNVAIVRAAAAAGADRSVELPLAVKRN